MGEYWVLFGMVGKVFPCIGSRGTKLGHGGPVNYPSPSAPKGFPAVFIEVPSSTLCAVVRGYVVSLGPLVFVVPLMPSSSLHDTSRCTKPLSKMPLSIN